MKSESKQMTSGLRSKGNASPGPGPETKADMDGAFSGKANAGTAGALSKLAGKVGSPAGLGPMLSRTGKEMD